MAMTAKSEQGRFLFARESAIPNAGEDLPRSARHIRNLWRGLEDAERAGTAEKLITRDWLLKLEPPAFDLTPTKALPTLGAYLALRKLWNKPITRSAHSDEKTRQEYYQAYREIKAAAEAAGDSATGPGEAIDLVFKKTRGLLHEARANDRSKPLCETLRRSYNAMIGHGPASPAGQIRAFQARLDEAGLPPDEAVRSFLDGKSLNETFGTSTGTRQVFRPADLYTGKAERIGGRVIEDPLGFLLNSAKMRGVQFGNSMTDDERQRHLRLASGAFADLADLLELRDEEISLGGILGIAFGARGKGTALAHYEPGLRVINLTRKNGLGSLAHEWGHFFDNMMAEEVAANLWIPEERKRYSSDGAAYYLEMPEEEMGLLTSFRGALEAMEPFKARIRVWLPTCHLISRQKRAYWLSNRELFARAFEKYLAHRLKESGRLNTHLTKDVRHPLWPTEDEVVAIFPAFDRLFAAYRESSASVRSPAVSIPLE
jgi:hypothetical protein